MDRGSEREETGWKKFEERRREAREVKERGRYRMAFWNVALRNKGRDF